MDTDKILTELETRFFDIPFENSDYQNKTFVITAQQTPGRAYRAIGLRMFSKIHAIKELKFNRQLEQIDIDEWQSVIDNTESSEFERRRAQVNIDKQRSMRGYTDKLLNDAIHELNFLYAKLQQFPEYDTEMFENEERQHFEQRLKLSLELRGNGDLQSLHYIEYAEQFEKAVQQLLEKS